MSHTNQKGCYCHTCDRWFNYLGIASHRAGHRRRKENCKITYTSGETSKYNYEADK